MDEQALNKKLAEGAGLCWHEFEYDNKGSTYYPLWIATCKHCGANVIGVKESAAKSKAQNGLGYDNPNFTQSLDACFKRLVPEQMSEITFMYASNCVSCDIEDLEGYFFEGHVNTDNIEEAWTKSALALCLAIEKSIDRELKV